MIKILLLSVLLIAVLIIPINEVDARHDANEYRLFIDSTVYSTSQTLYTNFHVQGVDARDHSTFITVNIEIRDSENILVHNSTLTAPDPQSLWWKAYIPMGISTGTNVNTNHVWIAGDYKLTVSYIYDGNTVSYTKIFEYVVPNIPAPTDEITLLREQVNNLTNQIELLNELNDSMQVIITTLNQILENLIGEPLPPLPTIPTVVNFPTVEITEPDNGQIFTEGETITFSAIASDIEDGENLEIIWESDFYGPLGTGNVVSLELTEVVGWDVISAIVIDSDSNVMIDDITITIIPREE